MHANRVDRGRTTQLTGIYQAGAGLCALARGPSWPDHNQQQPLPLASDVCIIDSRSTCVQREEILSGGPYVREIMIW